MVFLTLPSSKEDAAMKKNVLLNTLKISEQNREVGEREEKARKRRFVGSEEEVGMSSEHLGGGEENEWCW